MKFFVTVCLVIPLATLGCISKSKAKSDAQINYLRGQNETLMQLQQQKQAALSVTFVGEVQNRAVPWHEELSLSKAIIAAGYLGRTDPRRIVVLRNGQRYEVNPKELLRGTDDPLLEAGDVVQLSR